MNRHLVRALLVNTIAFCVVVIAAVHRPCWGSPRWWPCVPSAHWLFWPMSMIIAMSLLATVVTLVRTVLARRRHG